jgi:hypothetical protein
MKYVSFVLDDEQEKKAGKLYKAGKGQGKGWKGLFLELLDYRLKSEDK